MNKVVNATPETTAMYLNYEKKTENIITVYLNVQKLVNSKQMLTAVVKTRPKKLLNLTWVHLFRCTI